MWGSIVEAWESCNYGVRLEGEGPRQALVNHYLLAGSVVLVSTSATQLKRMVGMLTVARRRDGMGWKIESLDYLAGDPGLPHQLRGAVILPRKGEREILGVQFVTNPKGFDAVRHRIDAGRRCFFADI
eukprot:8689013-Pyramimonas_sp.AAC.1